MSENLTDWLFVIRRVRKAPLFFHNDGTVSSALFKDGNGVSVDKDHLRSIEEIIKDEERLHRHNISVEEERETPSKQLSAIVSIDRGIIEEQLVTVIDDPIIPTNPHHCLLYKNQNKDKLTKSQARALSVASVIIKRYA